MGNKPLLNSEVHTHKYYIRDGNSKRTMRTIFTELKTKWFVIVAKWEWGTNLFTKESVTFNSIVCFKLTIIKKHGSL